MLDLHAFPMNVAVVRDGKMLDIVQPRFRVAVSHAFIQFVERDLTLFAEKSVDAKFQELEIARIKLVSVVGYSENLD